VALSLVALAYVFSSSALPGVVVLVVTARLSAWESVTVRCVGWHLGAVVDASLWVTLSRSAVAGRACAGLTLAEVRGLCQFLKGGGDDQVEQLGQLDPLPLGYPVQFAQMPVGNAWLGASSMAHRSVSFL
jgi:hypothetical protein